MNLPLAGLRIGLITASASRLGGGVFEAVAAQAELIGRLGGTAVVASLADRHSLDDAHRFAGCELHHCPVTGPAQIGYSPRLVPVLLAAELDCLHLHGIWMYPSRAATLWARRTGRGYLVSPHGMLDPWITARGRWKKALARAGYERASWRRADRIHALTAGEAEDVRRESGRNDGLIIPNPAPACSDEASAPRQPLVAYIGRIHPKKNLPALVEGWRRASLPPGARLAIAGWGDAREVARLEAAAANAGPEIELLGPTYGAAKQSLLGSARFTILPSLSEGLPMAVLEGWAAGAPAVLTANCNLPEGLAAGAAIACGHSPDAIARALEQALALGEDEWLAMSSAAQGLARGPFSAASVAERWASAYRAACRRDRA